MSTLSFKNIVLVAATLFTTTTFAAPNQRIVIEMGHGGDHYRGAQTLPLKRMIKNQHPNIRLERFELLRVRVVGKSKNGNGTATLNVGQRQSYPIYLNGNRQDFHVNAPYTWDKQVIQNPKNNSQGAWQIKLQGNIKVKRIVAVLERQVVRPPRRSQASCLVKLETFWGADIEKYRATSFGRSPQQARQNACEDARRQCESSRLHVRGTKCSVK